MPLLKVPLKRRKDILLLTEWQAMCPFATAVPVWNFWHSLWNILVYLLHDCNGEWERVFI